MIDLPHQSWDIATVLFFNQYCGRSQFLDTLALVFLSVDALRTAILVALTVGIWQYGKSKSDISSQKRVIYILFSIILTLGIIEGLNALIESPRPIVSIRNLINNPITTSDTQLLWKDGWARNAKHGSFPSDTVALLATMATGLFLWNRFLGVAAFLFILIAGILPRLYFGLHYASDMATGVLIAISVTLLIEKFKFLDLITEKILNFERKFPYFFGVTGFYLAYIIAEKFILLRKLPIWIRTMIRH